MDEDPPDPAVHLIQAIREAQGLGIRKYPLEFRTPPSSATALDSMDQLLITGNRLMDDTAGQLAVRDWLYAGGRLWIMLDKTGMELPERLLGDQFGMHLVDEVPLYELVITETGAAKAVAKAYPKLDGKLTGNAIRVPTPNVSLAILNLNLKTSVDRIAVNEFLRDTALFSKLQHQIDYTASKEIVSTDLVGSRAASVVDSQATIAADSRLTLYVWYDNEFGYSCQVLRVVRDMAGLSFPTLPL